jgi:hypothetical protein
MTEKNLAMTENSSQWQKKNSQCTRILGVMLFPLARPVPGTDGQLLNKRRKKALIVLAGALPACPVGRFYVSVKRSPCAFGFCVRLVCAGCLRGKKGLLSAREGILKTALPLLMAFLTIYLIVVCVCRAVQI